MADASKLWEAKLDGKTLLQQCKCKHSLVMMLAETGVVPLQIAEVPNFSQLACRRILENQEISLSEFELDALKDLLAPIPQGLAKEPTLQELQTRMQSSYAKSLMEYQNLQSEMVKIRMKVDTIKLTGTGLTKQIGQQFKLVGLEDTAGRLLKILNEMLFHHEHPEDSFRYESRPHVIRIVAVPGLGKSTVLHFVWDSMLRLACEDRNLCPSLAPRLLQTLKQNSRLVIHMDFSKKGIAEFYAREKEMDTANILAFRLLFCATNSSESYSSFLRREIHKLAGLQPEEVLRFIAGNYGVDWSSGPIIAICLDEIDAVEAKCPDSSWFRRLLASLVELRVQLATQSSKNPLVVPITASTRSTTASLVDTGSIRAKLVDLPLLRLTEEDMLEIASDIFKRLPRLCPAQKLSVPSYIRDMLYWCSGNCRSLAWLLAAASGRSAQEVASEQLVVGAQQMLWTCEDRRNRSKGMLVKMIHAASQRWAKWLAGGSDLVLVLNQVYAHDLCSILVARNERVCAQYAWTWGQLEADGLLNLVPDEPPVPPDFTRRSSSREPRRPRTRAYVKQEKQAKSITEVPPRSPSPICRTSFEQGRATARSASPEALTDCDTEMADDPDLSESEQLRVASPETSMTERSENSSVMYPKSSSDMDMDEGVNREDSPPAAPEGHEQPDVVRNLHVKVILLVAAAAHNGMEVENQSLPPLGMLYGQDNWRDAEITHISILMAKLMAFKDILRKPVITLNQLHSAFNSEQRINVPISGYAAPVQYQHQVGSDKLAELLEENQETWAFLAPGNLGMDSYMLLQTAEAQQQYVVIQIQSKSSLYNKSINPFKSEAEIGKTVTVPADTAQSICLYVTDEHSRRSTLGVVKEQAAKGKKIVILDRDQHEELFSRAPMFAKELVRRKPLKPV